jgi:hypothetical protein
MVRIEIAMEIQRKTTRERRLHSLLHFCRCHEGRRGVEHPQFLTQLLNTVFPLLFSTSPVQESPLRSPPHSFPSLLWDEPPHIRGGEEPVFSIFRAGRTAKTQSRPSLRRSICPVRGGAGRSVLDRRSRTSGGPSHVMVIRLINDSLGTVITSPPHPVVQHAGQAETGRSDSR